MIAKSATFVTWLAVGSIGLSVSCSSNTDMPEPDEAGASTGVGPDLDGQAHVPLNVLVREEDGQLAVLVKAVMEDDVEEAIYDLEIHPHVLAASLATQVEEFGAVPDDPKFPQDRWGLEGMQFFLPGNSTADGWSTSTGAGKRVGVLDSGIGPNKDVPVVGGWDVEKVQVNRASANPYGAKGAQEYKDLDVHGTMVAGIIGAIKNNKVAIPGAAPGVGLVAIRYPAKMTSRIAQGILQARSPGNPFHVDILNISAGTAATDAPAVMTAIVEAATQAGILVVAAVGNSADEGNPINYPAALPNVLGVGGVANKAGFPVLDYSQTGWYVDIVAAGDHIVSTVSPPWYAISKSDNSRTTTESGTSFAAPYVSAAAAMVASTHSLNCRSLGTVNARRDCVIQIARRLQSTALRTPGVTTWTPTKGAGLLQVLNALTAPVSGFQLPTPPRSFSATVDPSASDTIMLSWAAPSSGTAHGYHVYRDGVKIGDVAGGTTQFRDKPAGQADVYYQVTAVNNVRGESFAAGLWRCSVAFIGFACVEELF